MQTVRPRIGFGQPRRAPYAERWQRAFAALEAERADIDAQLADLQTALHSGALPAASARAAAQALIKRRRTVAMRLARIGDAVPRPPWTG